MNASNFDTERLENAEQRLELALNGGDVGLWDWNLQTDTVFFSDQWHRQLGLDPSQVSDVNHWKSRVHPDDLQAAVKRIDDLIHSQDNEYESLFRMKHASGDYRWILSRGRLYRSEDGNPTRLIGVHLDVTDQKQNESRLEEQARQLDATNEELKQFAYAASHDLQQPLRGIANYSRFLLEDYSDRLDSEGIRLLNLQLAAAQRLKHLINDLLVYSQINLDQVPFAEVDLGEVLREVIESIELLIRENDASIEFDSLPVVSGIRFRLVQLMQNLIENAIKYRSSDSPFIRVSADEKDDVWEIVVQDNGVGIKREHDETVFQVFRRLENPGQIEGTGVGLALCKRIVHRHGGEIWVDPISDDSQNEASPGTRIVFTLKKR